MVLIKYQNQFHPQITENLQSFFATFDFGTSAPLGEMLSYHMGWQDSLGHGKRLRPLTTLLCTAALGGEATKAMPAALAIEFLHNFTLIHDDIEDRSPMRHGRETLWKRWGEAQAINAGDALFSIAQLAMIDLAKTTNSQVALVTLKRFNQTCLHLTRGQYLDISLENKEDASIDTYMDMIRGKTAALIAFSAAVGGLVTEAAPPVIHHLEKYGESLGLAFQIQDDELGIWGDPEVMGKSIASDLLAKKKTLPVLFGLQYCQEFREIWSEPQTTPDQIAKMAAILEVCGARQYVNEAVKQNIDNAFSALEALFPSNSIISNEPAKALFELSGDLLGRNF